MRLALAITLLLPGASHAQPAPTTEPPPAPTPQPIPAGKPAKTFAVDAVLVIPMSDYADEATIGMGALIRYEIPRSDVFALTLRGGGLFHIPADNRDRLLLFPALFGIRLAFADPWFFAADAGLVMRHQGKTEAGIGLAFGIGYRTGRVTLRGEILVPNLETVDSTAGVAGSAGLTF